MYYDFILFKVLIFKVFIMRAIDYSKHFYNDYEDEYKEYSDCTLSPLARIQSDERFYGLEYFQKWTKTEIGVSILLMISVRRLIFSIINGRYFFSPVS